MAALARDQPSEAAEHVNQTREKRRLENAIDCWRGTCFEGVLCEIYEGE